MKHAPLAVAVALGGLSLGAPALAGGFVEDSKAHIHLRNFYIDQDIRNQAAPGIEEWGQGVFLNFQSGYSRGPVGFGVDLLGLYGLRLDSGGTAGKDGISRSPGSLFPLESDGGARRDFGRLEPTAKMRFARTELKAGSLMPKLPVLTYGDSRLLPQTFRGAQVTVREVENLTLVAGQIGQAAERNSSDHGGMSIAGANDPHGGRFSHRFRYAGADYRAGRALQLQYYYGELKDFYRQHFVGLVHDWRLPVGSLSSDLRYFRSSSAGKNASAAGRAEGYLSSGYYGDGATLGEVDNRLWSALFTYRLKGHAIGAGYQHSAGDSDFPHINQDEGRTLHLISNAQIGRFTSAGERTRVLSYAYDFKALGLPGLKFSTAYYHGAGIRAAAGERSEWERDLRLDYVVQDGPLKGVGFTWRHGVQRGNDSKDKDEHRLIVSYSIALF